MKSDRAALAKVFELGVGLIGILLACSTFPGLTRIPLWLLLYWFALAILLEAILVPIGKTLITLIVALPIGVALAYGVAPAVWLLVVAELCTPWLRQSRPRCSSALFNAGQYAVSAWAMALVMRGVAPFDMSAAGGVQRFLAGLAGAAVFFVINHGLVQVCAWLWGRFSWRSAIEAAAWDGMTYLIAIPFDVIMVALQPINPVLAAVAFLPIVLLGQLLRMYRRMALMQQVHQLTGRLAAEFDVDRICEEAARLAAKLTDADSTAVFTLDERDHILLPNAIYPMETSTSYQLDGWREEDGSVVWQVARGTGMVYIPDAHRDPRLSRNSGLPTDRFRSVAMFPLRAQGHAHGVVMCFAANSHAFTSTLEYVSALAAQVAMLLENAKLYQELQELSWRDGATGLYNYRFFYAALAGRLQAAREHGQPLTVAIVDVDLFKKFNDTYGHLAGDAVLKSVAGLLSQLAGPGAIVARYGGEEFALILPVDPGAAWTILERIRGEISRHVVEFDGHRLQGLTVSCGFASFPDHGSNDRDLLLKADSALYWGAKQRGRNRTVVYAPEFDAQLFVDNPTGLYTLHFINVRLREELAHGVCTWGAICLDIEHFSQVNQRFGFDAGDQALRKVSLILKESLRQGELACRYGGDEFFVLLPIRSRSELDGVAERLVEAVASHPITLDTGVRLALKLNCRTELFTELNDFTDLADRVGDMFAELHAEEASRA
ncbi:sensor domain-containing diguanylate cyclase [Alicyclobacillus kakegawensis]|uniref:sensor domain-containing diguanylate cyclase n=1 Tax=Alicyclobacillus kakegawensis TaxID=392012 RepID=UPI00082E5A8F|nr:sensor domain-containing diguanylate cyclase [Alicyclobacillus kakegawensis]